MKDAGQILLWIAIILIIIGFYRAYRIGKRKQLMAKYNDEALVNRLMSREIWQGQTEEQLRESLGSPGKIDEEVLKTKTRRTYKYRSDGKGRYKLSVVVENGRVTGWKQR